MVMYISYIHIYISMYNCMYCQYYYFEQILLLRSIKNKKNKNYYLAFTYSFFSALLFFM